MYCSINDSVESLLGRDIRHPAAKKIYDNVDETESCSDRSGICLNGLKLDSTHY